MSRPPGMASGHETILANIELCEAVRLVQQLRLPPCPPLLADMLQEPTHALPDRRWIVQLITQDPPLAQALLAAVNAPLWGARYKVSSVQGALTFGGLDFCVHFVAGFMLRRALVPEVLPQLRTLWDRTAERALAIACIARELGVAEAAQAHAFGLFRDCGIALMTMRYPDYGAWRRTQRSEAMGCITDLERARYGVDHALLGGLLARNWCLPPETWLPVSLHHLRERVPAVDSAAEATRRLVAAGVLADCIVERMQSPQRRYDPFRQSEQAYASQVLGLVRSRVEKLRSAVALLLAAS